MLDPESLQKIIWLALVLLFAGAEAISVGLTSIWFAAGALLKEEDRGEEQMTISAELL